VQNTFIHAKLPPCTPLPRAQRRASSVPKDMGLGRALCCVDECQHSSLDVDEAPVVRMSSNRSNNGGLLSNMIATPSANFDSSATPLMHSRFCAEGTLSLEEDPIRNLVCFGLPSLPFASPTPMTPPEEEGPSCKASKGPHQINFSPDEPLSLEYIPDSTCSGCSRLAMVPTPQQKMSSRRVSFSTNVREEITITEVPDAAPQALRGAPALTPDTLLRDWDVVVQGTFLNVPPSLPTPFKDHASRRSHSEPRSMGSARAHQDSPVGGGTQQHSARLERHPETPCPIVSPSIGVFPPTPTNSNDFTYRRLSKPLRD